MQITKAQVVPVELSLQKPVQIAHSAKIRSVQAIFVRLETRQGQTAWGCTVANPDLTGEKPGEIVRLCRDCAALAPDLNPTNIEYSLAELQARTKATPSVLCASTSLSTIYWA